MGSLVGLKLEWKPPASALTSRRRPSAWGLLLPCPSERTHESHGQSQQTGSQAMGASLGAENT